MAGFLDEGDQLSETNALQFTIASALARLGTVLPVRVVAVASVGALAPAGMVDVQPMVAQTDGNGTTVPHGVIHGLPYIRIQGGAGAIILDPAVGDNGLALIANRDISAIKATGQPGPPGSRRRFDLADGIYLGGCLNGAPTMFVRFSTDGIEICSAAGIRITGDLTVTGGVTAGFGTGDAVTLQHHTHSGGSPPTAGT